MIKQSYNPKTKAYVKYKVEGNKSKILDVKQSNPSIPFKNIPITKKKR